MDSRQFIKVATSLVQRIKDSALVSSVMDGDNREEDEAIQKQINAVFSGLQNPTLPSAYKLRDVALQHGFAVDSRVQHRLTQGEGCWCN